RGSARAHDHPTGLATLSPTARAHHHRANPQPLASAILSAPRLGHASPRSARRTPPAAAGPRRQAPAPTPDQATARHQPRTRAAGPRPPRPTSSAPPTPPETGPERSPCAARTPRLGHPAEGQGDGLADPASAHTTGAGPRTRAPSLTLPRPLAR